MALTIGFFMHSKSTSYDVLFVIQMKDVTGFSPNYETDLNFANTLKTAQEKGVNIIAYDCNVYENKMELNLPVKVIL